MRAGKLQNGSLLLIGCILNVLGLLHGHIPRHKTTCWYKSPAGSILSPLIHRATTLSALSSDSSSGKNDLPSSSSSSFTRQVTRASFLQLIGATTAAAGIGTVGEGTFVKRANAFEGGVGGLGKTKPSTGVQLWDPDSSPFQNAAGIVSAEIQSVGSKKPQPILVQFQTPWPLLATTSGLEARDLRNSESAFVQVVPTPASSWKDRKVFQEILFDSVLASQGKFGAYGTPTDVKVKPWNEEKNRYVVTFTSYTPAMRESERQLWIAPRQIDNTLVLLIVGTTKVRFPSQVATFQNIMDSFVAVAAPETSLRGNRDKL